MRELTIDEIDDLALGATLLGTGGGGDPYVGKLLVKQAIADHGPAKVVGPEELPDDGRVLTTAIIGAPTVILEKIPAGTEFRAGIHVLAGLVGENGAGKSTVGKVIAGVHTADSGTVIVNGRPCRFRSQRQAFSAGITTIAQELALVPDRSVVDNVFLGVESTRWGFVNRGDTLRRFEALIERSGISVDGDASVRQLSVAEQQRVEILRAAARRSELIIMDEPSARLSVEERDQLHRLVHSLRDQHITVLFISHFLEEVLDLADGITVMRDGRVVKHTEPSSETAGSLVEAMIGRKLEGNFPPKPPPPDPDQRSALCVRGLRPAGLAGPRPVGRPGSQAEALPTEGLDLDVLPGEIVGIAGLVGSGRTEFVRSIYGDRDARGPVRGRVLSPPPGRGTDPPARLR